MTTWTAAWADPRFAQLVLGGTAVSMGSFLLFATPLTAMVAYDPPWLHRWHLQTRRPDLRRWLLPSLGRWLVNNLTLLVLLAAAWPWVLPWLTIQPGAPPNLLIAAAHLVAFAYLDDALYYVMHRALHHGALYRQVHAQHHRITAPFALSGHYMHPVEFVATGLLMLVGPVLVSAHVGTVYAWIVLRQLEAAEGHGGLHLPFSPLRLFPGSHGAAFHDAHHARFVGNYAGFFGWIDGRLGTWARGYPPTAPHHDMHAAIRAPVTHPTPKDP